MTWGKADMGKADRLKWGKADWLTWGKADRSS